MIEPRTPLEKIAMFWLGLLLGGGAIMAIIVGLYISFARSVRW